jgi:hypothetical protein
VCSVLRGISSCQLPTLPACRTAFCSVLGCNRSFLKPAKTGCLADGSRSSAKGVNQLGIYVYTLNADYWNCFEHAISPLSEFEERPSMIRELCLGLRGSPPRRQASQWY